MGIRRVVTGHDAAGKSVFARVDEAEAVTSELFPGWGFIDIWGGDTTPSFPDAGDKPAMGPYFPGVDGYRFSFSIIPPEGTPPVQGVDVEAETARANELLPGMLDLIEADGMHTTDTIDFEVIISGRVYLQLEDGVEELLQPGDTVVQNGTRHVWRNPGPQPCLMAVFMVGAHRATDPAT